MGIAELLLYVAALFFKVFGKVGKSELTMAWVMPYTHICPN